MHRFRSARATIPFRAYCMYTGEEFRSMTFETEGLLIVAIYIMVAAGELCCLSDYSGYIFHFHMEETFQPYSENSVLENVS